ncbi:MAG: Smr/MutS family protein [Polyangia bacterium]|jgi:DNA-nicking Smr family endonuclease|nr:Smr/MutS family protein [Polyangia bacterium]
MGRDTPFHNPFAEARKALSGKLKDWREADKRRREAERRERIEAASPPAPEPPVGEEQAYRQAMAGVQPLPQDTRVGAARSAPKGAPRREEDAEAFARLADLVAGIGPFEISDTLEFVEGLAQGVDRRLLRRLRKGEYAMQGHLDLHGLTRDEAREAVEGFVASSRTQGKRCVLIIHGRGLNSKEKEPVLKPALVAWLSRGRLGRQVLAFCTARPTDGGAGAVYVLLRK